MLIGRVTARSTFEIAISENAPFAFRLNPPNRSATSSISRTPAQRIKGVLGPRWVSANSFPVDFICISESGLKAQHHPDKTEPHHQDGNKRKDRKYNFFEYVFEIRFGDYRQHRSEPAVHECQEHYYDRE